MRKHLIVVLLIAVFLASCTSSDSVEPTEPENMVSTEANKIPTPENNLGVVHGELLNKYDNRPVRGIPFLARNLSYLDPEIPPTISFSLQSSPRAQFDKETGEYLFTGLVPADNYVIVLSYGPGSIHVVRDAEGEFPVIVSVKPNQILNLGTLLVKEP